MCTGWPKINGTIFCVRLNFIKNYFNLRIRRKCVIILSLKICVLTRMAQIVTANPAWGFGHSSDFPLENSQTLSHSNNFLRIFPTSDNCPPPRHSAPICVPVSVLQSPKAPCYIYDNCLVYTVTTQKGVTDFFSL